MLLEIGCGERKIYQDSMGLDRIKCGGVNVVADAHYLPFIPNSVEKVIYFEVMEHLESPFMALKEARRVGATCVTISIPNRYNYRHILRWILKEQTSVSEDHIYSWTLPEMTNILNKNGFSMVSHCFCTTHFHHKSPLRKLLPRIFDRSMVVTGVVL